MSDSKHKSPPPPDDGPRRERPKPERGAGDDESIDFGQIDSAEEGGSSLSFTGRSGPRSGR